MQVTESVLSVTEAAAAYARSVARLRAADDAVEQARKALSKAQEDQQQARHDRNIASERLEESAIVVPIEESVS